MCFVLSSSSASRLDLLKRCGFIPDIIFSPQTDESLRKKEHHLDYIKRVAIAKALAATDIYPDKVILAADTISYCRKQIIGKPSNIDEARKYLRFLEGRKSYFLTAVCIARKRQCRAVI